MPPVAFVFPFPVASVALVVAPFDFVLTVFVFFEAVSLAFACASVFFLGFGCWSSESEAGGVESTGRWKSISQYVEISSKFGTYLTKEGLRRGDGIV